MFTPYNLFIPVYGKLDFLVCYSDGAFKSHTGLSFTMDQIFLHNARLITFLMSLSFCGVIATGSEAKASDPLTLLLRAVDMNIGETASGG